MRLRVRVRAIGSILCGRRTHVQCLCVVLHVLTGRVRGKGMDRTRVMATAGAGARGTSRACLRWQCPFQFGSR